jgi:hypothetical protein
MTDQHLPRALQKALDEDSAAVHPLPSEWLRLLWALGVSAAVLVATVVGFGLRSDMGQIPMWLSWGCSVFELILAAALFALALRESVPGRAVPVVNSLAAVTLAVIYQVTVGLVTYLFSAGLDYNDHPLAHGVGCMKQDVVSTLPILVVITILILRAAPVRAPHAGFLAGAGAAIAADAVTHLRCPVSDMRHVLLWHTGAVLGFAVGGWLLGLVWQRIRGGRL